MNTLLRPGRFGAVLLAVLLVSAFAAPTFAEYPEGGDGLSAVVVRSAFAEPDAHLAHNIPDLRVTVGDEDIDCDFLAHYESTGSVTRWGFATSEVIEERPGSLTQYYQRGVVDCQERDGMWRMERRLVWDYVGGGLGDAPDLGVEPDVVSNQVGLPLGPWGHRVANLAVDGTPTGFLDFFVELGGLQAFGLPKSDARLDDAPGAMLSIEGADPGVIRQYFQAAVFEHRPGRQQPVQLRLLGDAVRDRIYPFDSHQVFPSFQSARPLRDGQSYAPEGTSVRAVLVTLYEATDGADWNENDNWLSDAPLGDWFGVTADDHDRVIGLSLSQNQLSGVIPAQIGRLTDLENLNLWANQLRGEIPPQIGRLRNLQALSLVANQLHGSIPPELGNLGKLVELRLRLNQLSGPIPPNLGALTDLTYLDFAFNQLSGAIPPELGNLTSLTRMIFWANRLEGEIPPELGNLTNLEQLDVDRNRLTGAIPPELGNLVSLEELWLHRNRLTGQIPSELGNLANLQYLDVHGNHLTGEIPSALGNLARLEWLWLHDNRLTGQIPSELGNLANLQVLRLTQNQLTGCVPAALAAVPTNDVDELGLPLCEAEEPEDMEDTEDPEGAIEA